MAYPLVSDYTIGTFSTLRRSEFDIPLPTCNAGDLLVCFVSLGFEMDNITNANVVPIWGSSSNFTHTTLETSYDGGTNWLRNPPPNGLFHGSCYRRCSNPDRAWSTSLSVFIASALGGTNDVLKVGSFQSGHVAYSGFPSMGTNAGNYWWYGIKGVGNIYTDEHFGPYPVYSKPAYICYRITQAYDGPMYKVEWSGSLPFAEKLGIAATSIHSNKGYLTPTPPQYWTMPRVPDSWDLYTTNEYLAIMAISSAKNHYATGAPTGWTNLLTAGNDVYIGSAISSCRREIVSHDYPGNFINPPYEPMSAIGIRISPVPETISPPLVIEGGIGTYIYKEAVVYEEPVDQIQVTPINQVYNSDGTPSINNPYQIYVELVATGAWTCAWNTGTYFTAGQYSGLEGTTYIAINCVGSNGSAGSYTDTLIFYGPGVSSDSVNVEQYNI